MLIRGALEARQLFIRNAKIDDTVLELLQVFHAFQRLQQTPLRAGGLVWNWLPMEEEGLVRLRPSETHLLASQVWLLPVFSTYHDEHTITLKRAAYFYVLLIIY